MAVIWINLVVSESNLIFFAMQTFVKDIGRLYFTRSSSLLVINAYSNLTQAQMLTLKLFRN